ncbi:rhodanese-like domain-containing protein [Salinicola tamaricis]|uniref:rhodanese-like domain-containing protein n=1 Tax=Salinicola tamaricis TaxID=1771309 RepID=UPI0030F3933A
MSGSEFVEADLALLKWPLIDVRAPIEFAAGALPGAINLPLMDDDERREVGIRYKLSGQEAAVALGNELVTGDLRERRLDAWEAALDAAPESIIYCFRGGMRSKISQQWLRQRGRPVPRIRGGWKAMRNALLGLLEQQSSGPLLLVAGLTGCAKTALVGRSTVGSTSKGWRATRAPPSASIRGSAPRRSISNMAWRSTCGAGRRRGWWRTNPSGSDGWRFRRPSGRR